MITILGATGQTGGKIARLLQEAGEHVRLVGRSAGKLAELRQTGAEIAVGDATDATFLTEAFRGADAIYTLVAADPHVADYRAEQHRIGKGIETAIRRSGVRHVVALSSLGADLESGSGVIAGLHAQEERLRQIADTNLLLLRPASFFENCFAMLPLLKAEGIFGDGLAAYLPMPLVATRDIAAVAASALRARLARRGGARIARTARPHAAGNRAHFRREDRPAGSRLHAVFGGANHRRSDRRGPIRILCAALRRDDDRD